MILLFMGSYLYKTHRSVETYFGNQEDYIKWVDFNVSYEALQRAYEWDKKTYQQEVHLDWIEMLSFLAVKYGGNFSKYRGKDLDELAQKLIDKEGTIESLLPSQKYYTYYLEAYSAVLGGLVGEYEIELDNEWHHCYGLKAYSPIAMGYDYCDYDDFGSSRSYGFKREHLGHDLMGQTGTPIIAIESGTVEAIGWNQYGGWRIGIRSFDKKRYYYYAHMRQNFPYNKSLKEGSVVQSGDVIGYIGHTGYSTKENVNNIDTSHLHWGLQLIFDESQKESNNEIWVDCYQITRFLSKNRSETWKDITTKEYRRKHAFKDIDNSEFLENVEDNSRSISGKSYEEIVKSISSNKSVSSNSRISSN